MMRKPEYDDFRWNCETLYCVEEFWHYASEEDRADFAKFVKEGILYTVKRQFQHSQARKAGINFK